MREGKSLFQKKKKKVKLVSTFNGIIFPEMLPHPDNYS